MKWTVHDERIVYSSPWMSLALTTVEPPGVTPFEHHVVRYPCAAAGCLVHDPDRGVLLIWRHRFTTDTWGWEIPAGRTEPGESPEIAAIRETVEEAGWEPTGTSPMVSFHPANGTTDIRFDLFHATGARYVGEPTDPTEAERVEWLAVPEVRRVALEGEMLDGLSLTAVTYAFTAGLLQ